MSGGCYRAALNVPDAAPFLRMGWRCRTQLRPCRTSLVRIDTQLPDVLRDSVAHGGMVLDSEVPSAQDLLRSQDHLMTRLWTDQLGHGLTERSHLREVVSLLAETGRL